MGEAKHKVDEEQTDDIRVTVKTDSYTSESASVDSVKQTDAFSKIDRRVTEVDLKSPGAIQWLLSEHDKYDDCLKQFNKLKDDFHEKDKECSIAQEKIKSNTAFEVLYSSALSMGSALIGAFVSFDNNIKWLAIITGGIMLLGGIVAKLITAQKK